MVKQSLVLVFDESISPRICWAIEGFCREDTSLTFRTMDRGLKDADWLAGEFPPDPTHVVITKDSVLRPRGQTLVWLRGGLTVVIIDGRLGNMLVPHLAAILIRWWHTIEQTVRGTPRQGAFVVPLRFVQRDRLPKWSLKKRRRKVKRTKRIRKRQKVGRVHRSDLRQGNLELPPPGEKNNGRRRRS